MFKQGKTTILRATSRASVKINDCFYTFEFTEEIDTRHVKDSNLEAEKNMLWERVHQQVDNQVRQIVEG